MRVKLIFIGFGKKEEELDVKKGKRYLEILEELKINPETVVLIRDSTPVPVDEFVSEGEITVIRVISGG
jgi:sulfur carrier protein